MMFGRHMYKANIYPFYDRPDIPVPVIFYGVPDENPSMGATCFNLPIYEAREHQILPPPCTDPYSIEVYNGVPPCNVLGIPTGEPDWYLNGISYDTYINNGYTGTACDFCGESIGSAPGDSTSQAASTAITWATGTAPGDSTSTATRKVLFYAYGTAPGASTSLAVTISTIWSVGTAPGASTSPAVAISTIWSVGTAPADSTAPGTAATSMPLFNQPDWTDSSGAPLYSTFDTDSSPTTGLVFQPITVPSAGWTMTHLTAYFITTAGPGLVDVAIYPATTNAPVPNGGPNVTTATYYGTGLASTCLSLDGSTCSLDVDLPNVNITQGYYYIMVAVRGSAGLGAGGYFDPTISTYQQYGWFQNPDGNFGVGTIPVPDTTVTGLPAQQDYAIVILGTSP